MTLNKYKRFVFLISLLTQLILSPSVYSTKNRFFDFSDRQQQDFDHRLTDENTEANTDNNKQPDNQDYQFPMDLDTSIFGNTYGESFFEFGNRKANEFKNINKNLFDKAINSCPYSTPDLSQSEYSMPSQSFTNAQSNSQNCILASMSFQNFYRKTSDRLFLFDAFVVGLVSSTDLKLRLYNFNMLQKTLTHIRTKTFHGEVPFDACADKYKNIYIVFPEQNKIGKYVLNQTFVTKYNRNSNSVNKTQSVIKEVISMRDADFSPTSIACHDDLIYVSERVKNQIRVYDKILRLIRIINLNGVVVSAHNSLAVNQNVRVLIDGADSLALFNPSHPNVAHLNAKVSPKRKYSLVPENNRVNVCHFYKNMECLEDVNVIAETKTKSYIYVADSCERNIKEFHYTKDEKIKLENRLNLPEGEPVSVVTNPLGYLFVLTDNPRKIYVLDPRECNKE